MRLEREASQQEREKESGAERNHRLVQRSVHRMGKENWEERQRESREYLLM